ncbi:MAG: hypothetical protein L6Q81_05665 [Bacteroidia bacterium]|nr:hypothetical protein [Bacteroidia bacterium]
MRLLLTVLIFLSCIIPATVSAQTILKQDGKYGVSDENGVIVLKPVYDSIIADEYTPTFFIIRNGGKYTYFYKHGFDSTTWIQKEDRHWILGEFEFDSMELQVIGASYYDLSFGYSVYKYSKASKWGLFYLQTYTVSGDGIFPSAGFYAYEYGKLELRDARYDAILRSEPDDFFTTYLNGRYGLWNVVTGEEYASEFDTIPVFRGGNGANGWYGLRERYVRKNGKWGVVRMIKKTKSLEYVVPCKCNKVSKIWDDLYGCTGYGDTITFFDNVSHTEYTPTLNGKPFVYTNDSINLHIDASLVDLQSPQSAVISVTYKNNSPPKSKIGYNELYYVNIRQKKITAYNEPGKYYSICTAQQNGLLIKTDLRPSGSQRLYEFYNMETGEFRFSFSIDSSYRYRIDNYTPKNCAKEDEYRFVELTKFPYRGDKRIVKGIGYYDFREEKFTRRKPKYKPSH